jgi:hypothetical protein
MKRRTFIAALGGAAAWPLVGRAQQSAKVYRVGLLATAGAFGAGDERRKTILEGLAARGFVEGRNLVWRGAMRIAIILYCLLSAIINVSAAENVTPGKYLCVVSDAVGLQTNASTHQRYGGAITLPPERPSSSSPSRKSR